LVYVPDTRVVLMRALRLDSLRSLGSALVAKIPTLTRFK